MQGFVIPIRFRMFQSETYVRENEILEKKTLSLRQCKIIFRWFLTMYSNLNYHLGGGHLQLHFQFLHF